MPRENFEFQPREEAPKRKSGVSKIVGAGSIEQEKELLEVFNKPFEYPEKEKTPEQEKIIGGILKRLPEFVERYKGVPVEIKPEQIHFLDYEKLGNDDKNKVKTSEKEIRGEYMMSNQHAWVIDEKSNLQNAQVIIHELIHFNSFQSVTKNEKEHKLEIRRQGFEIESKKHGEIFFNEINEAVTEELTKRFDNEYFSSMPETKEEVHGRTIVRKAAKGKADDVARIEIKELDNNQRAYNIESYAYKTERKKLKNIINDIYRANPEEFATKEEVFIIFAEAVMSGQLLKVARFVEKTYGKGSFRKLGEETKKK